MIVDVDKQRGESLRLFRHTSGTKNALRFKTAKNWDVSFEPPVRPFACSLAPFTHSLALLSRSAALIHSLALSLTHSRARGKVNHKMLWYRAVLNHGTLTKWKW